MSKTVLTVPIEQELTDLTIGDVVYISGTIMTARDMAHLRMREYLEEGKELPFDPRCGVIFHAGPVVKKADEESYNLSVIGPTTSIRMEPYADVLVELTVRAVIGKGGMGESTSEALKRVGGVYLQAPPGCAVKLAEGIKGIKKVHWLDLGVPEAVWVLEAEMFGPLIVGMDSKGNSIYRNVRESALAKVRQLVMR